VKRAPVKGGPADGLEAAADGPPFTWLEVTVLRRKERTPNAGLYKLVNGVYEYIGGHASTCNGCGAVFERAEGGAEKQPCPLCGHKDVAEVAA